MCSVKTKSRVGGVQCKQTLPVILAQSTQLCTRLCLHTASAARDEWRRVQCKLGLSNSTVLCDLWCWSNDFRSYSHSFCTWSWLLSVNQKCRTDQIKSRNTKSRNKKNRFKGETQNRMEPCNLLHSGAPEAISKYYRAVAQMQFLGPLYWSEACPHQYCSFFNIVQQRGGKGMFEKLLQIWKCPKGLLAT